MPMVGVTVAKLDQKNSGKKPSAGEEQAKEAALMEAIKTAHEKANDANEAALMKEAIYNQKIAAWKQSTQDKVNIIKAAEEADDKKEQEKVVRIKAARKKAIKKTERKNSDEKPSVEEEQAKEAVLKKVVMYGQKIAAWERSIQAKDDAKKAEEKAVEKKQLSGRRPPRRRKLP